MCMRRISPDCFSPVIGVTLLGVLVVGCAPTGPPVDRSVEKRESFTREEGPRQAWQEIQTAFPAYPSEEHLTEVEIPGPTSFTFMADTQSIRVDGDGVVRYTLIARSPSGTDNVSFEGMRCETGEYKFYALGSVDRTWMPSRSGDWRPIRKQSGNDYRFALYKLYFCPYGVPPTSSSKAVAALKRGIPHPEGR